MKDISSVISSSLFKGIPSCDISELLTLLHTQKQAYLKGQIILSPGQITSSLGLVLHGKIIVSKEDFWGNRNLLSTFSKSDCFAETFAFSGSAVNVCVEALTDCSILWIPVSRLSAANPVLMQNLLQTLALRNLSLTEKLSHLSHRNTRDKLLSYLSSQSVQHHSPEFDIPFNRQQLSDYLLIERSGCSAELCKMRDEGLIGFHKNHFRIKK